ncbi:MAG: hypothetical protein ACPG5L_16200 [Vibrio gallaecicus]
MEKLPVRFPKKQTLCISDLMDTLGSNQSDMARAAMQLGLSEIKEMAEKNKKSAQDLVAINAYMAKQ